MSKFWDELFSILPYATVVILAPLALVFEFPAVALVLLIVSFTAVLCNFGGFIFLPLLIMHLAEMSAAAAGVYRQWS